MPKYQNAQSRLLPDSVYLESSLDGEHNDNKVNICVMEDGGKPVLAMRDAHRSCIPGLDSFSKLVSCRGLS